MKDLWSEQFETESENDKLIAKAETEKIRAKEAEDRLAQERDWAARHPNEWSEWIRLSPLLFIPINFGTGEQYDFPQFLSEVGDRPSTKHIIERRDETINYMQGNLVWVKQKRHNEKPHPVDSPYLTVNEAAEYCRRAPKTILNHHSLGNIRSMPGTRPPLFRREALDKWLSTHRKPRTK